MDPQSVADMLREDRHEWAELVRMLDAHPAGPLHDPESPEWTARDVYTHLAAMMEGSTRLIEEYLAGQPHRRIYEGDDEDDVNRRIQEQHSAMSLEDARAWAERALDALHNAIESIPPDRWDKRLEFYARADGSEHIRGHRNYIAVTKT
jgi:hypothetical protein